VVCCWLLLPHTELLCCATGGGIAARVHKFGTAAAAAGPVGGMLALFKKPCDWETWWSSDSRYQLQTETYSLLDSSCSYLMINERNEDDWAATECFSRLYSIQTVGGNLTSPTALCNCIFKSQITFCLLSRNIRLQCSTSWFGYRYWQYWYVPCHVNSLTCKVGWYSFSVHFLATVFFKSWAVFYWRFFAIFACEYLESCVFTLWYIWGICACCHSDDGRLSCTYSQ